MENCEYRKRTSHILLLDEILDSLLLVEYRILEVAEFTFIFFITLSITKNIIKKTLRGFSAEFVCILSTFMFSSQLFLFYL